MNDSTFAVQMGNLLVAFVAFGMVAIVSLAAAGASMTISNLMKYRALKKCYGKVFLLEQTTLLFFPGKQDGYVECCKLDWGLKVAIADLLRRYLRILLLMQWICASFIMLIPPAIMLMPSNYRTAKNAIFFILYVFFFVIVAVFLEVVRKRVVVVVEWIQQIMAIGGIGISRGGLVTTDEENNAQRS